ncbi:hypothetical protein [Idiomarina sp.]|uniref:hypothetical protein n=1 Tax=Idiomarina sp. TaxID=1874361 RepID=UPI0026236CB4|nr:hypothetical protein [Idiomarina sp.]
MDHETKILIAIISASAAIAGAIFSQVITLIRDYQEKKHKRRILLREKYEELAYLVTESQGWLSEQMRAPSMRALRGSHPAAARKAMVLSHIYFPKLHGVCEDYLNSLAKFQIMLIENHEFHPEHDAGTQAAHKNPEAIEQAGSHVQSCRQKLDEFIIKYARKYANA